MTPRLFPGTAWVLALLSRKILYLGLVLQNSLGLEQEPAFPRNYLVLALLSENSLGSYPCSK